MENQNQTQKRTAKQLNALLSLYAFKNKAVPAEVYSRFNNLTKTEASVEIKSLLN